MDRKRCRAESAVQTTLTTTRLPPTSFPTSTTRRFNEEELCPLCKGSGEFLFSPQFTEDCLEAALKLNLVHDQVLECPFCPKIASKRFRSDEVVPPVSSRTPPYSETLSEDVEILRSVLPKHPGIKRELEDNDTRTDNLYSQFSDDDLQHISKQRCSELVLNEGCHPVASLQALLEGAASKSEAKDAARAITANQLEQQTTALMQVESERAARKQKLVARAETLRNITEDSGVLFEEYLVPTVPPIEVEATGDSPVEECICGEEKDYDAAESINALEHRLAIAAPRRRIEFFELVELLGNAVRWYGVGAQRYCDTVEEELCRRVAKLQLASEVAAEPEVDDAVAMVDPEGAVVAFQRKELSRLRVVALCGLILQRFISLESGRLQLAMFLPRLRDSLAMPILFKRNAVTQIPQEVEEVDHVTASDRKRGRSGEDGTSEFHNEKRLRSEEWQELENPPTDLVPHLGLSTECCRKFAESIVGAELLVDRHLMIDDDDA